MFIPHSCENVGSFKYEETTISSDFGKIRNQRRAAETRRARGLPKSSYTKKDPFEVDYFGRSALHMIVTENDVNGARIQIGKGSNVNGQDCLGNTPLHLAVMRVNPEMVHLLIRKGANPNICLRGTKRSAFTMVSEKLARFPGNMYPVSGSPACSRFMTLKTIQSSLNMANLYSGNVLGHGPNNNNNNDDKTVPPVAVTTSLKMEDILKLGNMSLSDAPIETPPADSLAQCLGSMSLNETDQSGVNVVPDAPLFGASNDDVRDTMIPSDTFAENFKLFTNELARKYS